MTDAHSNPPDVANGSTEGQALNDAQDASPVDQVLQQNEADESASAQPGTNPSQTFPIADGSMDSIHSLLAASQQLAQSAHVPWAQDAHLADSSKRKRDESPSQDNNPNKIRKTGTSPLVHNGPFANGGQVVMTPPPLPHMTTVTCLHAAVAQKSYGNEKRFLCPPPVVRIDTPIPRSVYFRSQQLSMRIFPEINELPGPPPEQKASLDDTMQACFKYLHVGGTQKSKSFHLSLDLAEPAVFDPMPNQGANGSNSAESSNARLIKPASTWASFSSAPVTIISKPSKKTAKTRNLASCILAGGPVSLFNRINSQTVRTKYMTVDQGRLCASNTTWSAFNVEVVQAVTDPNAQPPDVGTYHPGGVPPQPVTYGSTLLLTDSHTGLTSDPLVIRKVDKGRIVMDEGTMGGPVSQMQKVALCRITETGARYYLSAAGPLQILPDPSGAATDGKGVIATHPLVYQPPAVREEVKGDVRMEVDEVDDFLCWTIVGISKFQYTFFDGIHNNALARFPITPFPTLLSPPIYKPQTHTLDLTIANYFYTDPTPTSTDANGYPQHGPPQPLEIWLGTLGPLNARVYQNGELTHTIGAALAGPAGGPTGASIVAHQTSSALQAPGQTMLGGMGSTIVVVEMPPMRDILRMVEVVTGADLGLGLGGAPVPAAALGQMTSMEGEEGEKDEEANGGGEGPSAETEPKMEKKGKGKAKDKEANGAGAAPPQPPQPPQHPGMPPYPHYPHMGMPMPPLTRGIPILFVRTVDGIGYHSGREIACENILGPMAMANGAANTIESWVVRVL
ncbi:hypothetical protein FRC00_005202 [Tulasnella sp. 408]|nr:hypothetical protein FRC00_005202 [Tulasnella sp. 408]